MEEEVTKENEKQTNNNQSKSTYTLYEIRNKM